MEESPKGMPPAPQPQPPQTKAITELYQLLEHRTRCCLSPMAIAMDFEALSATLAQFNKAVQDAGKFNRTYNGQKKDAVRDGAKPAPLKQSIN